MRSRSGPVRSGELSTLEWSPAIGGDGGGSSRSPSAFCGLFGLKPQRGRMGTSPNRNLWRGLGTLRPSQSSGRGQRARIRRDHRQHRDDTTQPTLRIGRVDTRAARIAVSARSPFQGITPSAAVVAQMLAPSTGEPETHTRVCREIHVPKK